MNRKQQVLKYLIGDFLAAVLAWGAFYSYRKLYIEEVPLAFDEKFYIGILIIPLFWLGIYAITGLYTSIYRKSRLKELGQTIFLSLIGVLFIFFAILLDDEVASYKQYYKTFFVLFSFHFLFTYIPRFFLTSTTAYRIHNRMIGFNTLLVGSNGKALQTYQEMESVPRSAGNKFVGYVNINGSNGSNLKEHIPHLGGSDEIIDIIKEHDIEEVIIAIDSTEHVNIKQMITKLDATTVITKITPDMYGEKIVSTEPFDESLFTENEIQLLEFIVQTLGSLKASRLVEMSHEEVGWLQNQSEKAYISYSRFAFDLKENHSFLSNQALQAV